MNEQLLTTRQIADHFQVSVDYILDMCKDGTFQPSLHYIDIRRNGRKRANYRFRLRACISLFSSDREIVK